MSETPREEIAPEILSADLSADDLSSPEAWVALQDQLAAAQSERDEAQHKYLRALAENDTYRRRVMKERDDDRKFAPLGIIKDLIPNLDNLRRAIEAAQTASSIEDLSKGSAWCSSRSTKRSASTEPRPLHVSVRRSTRTSTKPSPRPRVRTILR